MVNIPASPELTNADGEWTVDLAKILRPRSWRGSQSMHPFYLIKVLAAVVAVGAVVPVSSSRPDEGMWPFDGLPLKQLKEKYESEQ